MTTNIIDRRPGTPARLVSDFLNELSITLANTAGELSLAKRALPFPEQPGDDIDQLWLAMDAVSVAMWELSDLFETASARI